MKYSITQIAEIINSEANISYNSGINTLLTDSRSLSDPSQTLFFALVTSHNDGHNYIKNLYERGVRNFVVKKGSLKLGFPFDANILSVDDTLAALQKLAVHHRSCFHIPVIGITGSNGKTIVKEWLWQLLHTSYNITRSPRSYNSQIGVPLSVWQINEQTQLGIFEAGMSLPGEMNRLEPIIKPTLGIFTNIGDAHQENFTSIKQKCLEKLQLFRHSEQLIYCEDDAIIHSCVQEAGLNCKTFRWSTINKSADLFIEKITVRDETSHITYQLEGKANEINIPFIDKASVENTIHCLATLIFLKNNHTEEIKSGFLKLEPVAMRLDVKKGTNNCILINDTYNSDINSLDIALDFMARRSLNKKMKSIIILSDVLQSGIEPEIFYRKVANLLQEKGIRHLVGIGKHITENANKFQMEKEFYPDTDAYLKSQNFRTFHDSMILIKGSRSFHFERISEQLEEKVHETVLEVDLDAIVHNYKYFRSLLKPKTRITCMVKAFGYGIGSYELAKTLQEQGCDYLAVAVADEGAELRREGITTPIMVMNPEMYSFNILFDYNLEPEIYNFRILNAMVKEAERRGITNYPIHIKVNTGMNRLGFDSKDIDNLISVLQSQQSLVIRSVFSHWAGSDSPELDSFTKEQAGKFRQIAEILKSRFSYPILMHISNSAGIERHPQYQFDMVRLGIGLYGISSASNHQIKPVATLKTTILQIRDVSQNETVGYNCNGKLLRDSRIACLPIGYADGLDRHLGNGTGKVLINGVLCSIAGNICMDICMVDVTDVEALEGDTAVIFGENIPVENIAEQLGTIPYEIFTSVSPRVKRIYYKE